MKTLKALILLFLALSLFCFFYFHLYRQLSLEALRQHQALLLAFRDQNYLLAVLVYVLLYTVAISASFPGAILFTLIGGYLFGLFPGLLYVHLSVTLGSTLIFLLLRFVLSDWVRSKLGPTLLHWEEGFKENAFSYLLTLRLIPLIPFWATNFLASALGLKLRTFVSATALGIIPSVIIYTSVGENLGHLLEAEKSLSFLLLLQPRYLLPLLGLAFLAISPVIYKKYKT